MNNLSTITTAKQIINNEKCDGFLLSSPAMLQYFTGIEIPCLESKSNMLVYAIIGAEKSIVVAPSILAPVIFDQGWKGNVFTYSYSAEPTQALMSAVIDAITSMFGSKNVQLLCDGNHIPFYIASALQEKLSGLSLRDYSEEMNCMRAVKNEQELYLLERAAYYADHGIAGAMHHIATGRSRSEKYIAEDVRVHSLERGLHIGGYDAVSQIASGTNSGFLFPEAPHYFIGRDKTFGKGETVRMAMKGRYYGYCADDARILFMDAPDEAQDKTYNGLVELRKLACDKLRPGTKACEVYAALSKKAQELGLNVLSDLGFGHSIGVAYYEEPFIVESDTRAIEENMCFVISLHAKTDEGDILVVNDTVVVGKKETEVIGWYENWDVPYITAFTF